MGASVMGLPRNRFEANCCVLKVGEICSVVLLAGAGGRSKGHQGPPARVHSAALEHPTQVHVNSYRLSSSARNGYCGCFALFYKVGEIQLGIQKEKPLTGGFFRPVLFFVYALFER